MANKEVQERAIERLAAALSRIADAGAGKKRVGEWDEWPEGYSDSTKVAMRVAARTFMSEIGLVALDIEKLKTLAGVADAEANALTSGEAKDFEKFSGLYRQGLLELADEVTDAYFVILSEKADSPE